MVVLTLSHLEPGMNNKPVVGEHHTLNGDNIATKVMHTGRPARLDSSELKIAPGSIAARLRETGLRCTVTVALPPSLMAQSPTTPTRDENPYVVGTSEGRMEQSSIPVDQDLLCDLLGSGGVVGPFDEFAVLELRAGADERHEMWRVDRPPA